MAYHLLSRFTMPVHVSRHSKSVNQGGSIKLTCKNIKVGFLLSIRRDISPRVHLFDCLEFYNPF
jgi:hypothetical protein